MAVQVQSITNRVYTQLMDAGSVRWTQQELTNWICDGQRALVVAAPWVSSKVTVLRLAAGTRQTIPADGYMFIRANRNMGANGLTPGAVPLPQPRMLMDTQYPTWHQDAAVVSPTTIVFDPDDPQAFYVHAPSDGTGTMEIVYSVMPPDLTAPTDTIAVHDIFQTALFDFCMWRAQQKDSDYAAGMTAAQQYFAPFASVLATLRPPPQPPQGQH